MTFTPCQEAQLRHVHLGLRPTRPGVGADAAPLRRARAAQALPHRWRTRRAPSAPDWRRSRRGFASSRRSTPCPLTTSSSLCPPFGSSPAPHPSTRSSSARRSGRCSTRSPRRSRTSRGRSSSPSPPTPSRRPAWTWSWATPGRAAAPSGTQVVELEATDAVCGVHLGPVTGLPASWQELHRGAVDNGHEFAGPCREHYVRAEGEDQSDWVIELQQPITRSAG